MSERVMKGLRKLARLTATATGKHPQSSGVIYNEMKKGYKPSEGSVRLLQSAK